MWVRPRAGIGSSHRGSPPPSIAAAGRAPTRRPPRRPSGRPRTRPLPRQVLDGDVLVDPAPVHGASIRRGRTARSRGETRQISGWREHSVSTGNGLGRSGGSHAHSRTGPAALQMWMHSISSRETSSAGGLSDPSRSCGGWAGRPDRELCLPNRPRTCSCPLSGNARRIGLSAAARWTSHRISIPRKQRLDQQRRTSTLPLAQESRT